MFKTQEFEALKIGDLFFSRKFYRVKLSGKIKILLYFL